MNSENESKEPKRKGLRLVEKYENDDYSRFSGPDFVEEPFELGEEDFEHSPHTKQNVRIRKAGSWEHPGISGKTDDGETWVNEREYKMQTSFVGYGPKGYKRSDDRIYEEVCETLMKNPDVDASYIGVKVDEGIVYLTGKVQSRHMKKIAELIVDDLPGVQDVRNELAILKSDLPKRGPDAPTRQDLGVT